MNYLAHLLLSKPTVESRLGNFLGDFMHGESMLDLDPGLKEGIDRHNLIDAYTDGHPRVLISRNRINHEKFHHQSGILIDIFYDHFLAKYWADYSDQSLESFAQEIYHSFLSFKGYIPKAARFVINRMTEARLLESYQTIQGIDFSLRRLALKMRHPVNIASAATELVGNYSELKNDFRIFFPELQAHTTENSHTFGKNSGNADIPRL